jgi:hypothetical protein
MSHGQAGTYTQARLAVGHPKYPCECTLPSYHFHHLEARSCTRAKPELAAAALTHLRRFVKPSLGGKAFKSEPPVVFFPLDPKKRHHQWATWWVFGSSETGGLSEDPEKRHHESQNWRSFGFAVSQALLALALCLTRESRRSGRYRVLRDSTESTPEVPAIASRLTRSIGCGIHIRSSRCSR